MTREGPRMRYLITAPVRFAPIEYWQWLRRSLDELHPEDPTVIRLKERAKRRIAELESEEAAGKPRPSLSPEWMERMRILTTPRTEQPEPSPDARWAARCRSVPLSLVRGLERVTELARQNGRTGVKGTPGQGRREETTFCMDDGPNPYGSLETWQTYRAELDLLPDSVMNKAELIERADWMIAQKEAADRR